MHERSLKEKSRRVTDSLGGCSRATSPCLQCVSRSCPFRWHPYLATLPAREPLPVTWTPEQQALLQGTELVDSIQRDRQLMAADWDTVIQPLVQAHPDRLAREHFTLDAYVDARTITASRGFSVDAYHGHGLVPFADLFNHEVREDVHFTSDGDVCPCCGKPDEEDEDEDEDEEGGADGEDDVSPEEAHAVKPAHGPCPVCRRDVGAVAEPQWSEHCIAMVTQHPVAAGAELFNTYGLRNNAALLHMYGFTLRSNPHGSCSIRGQLVRQALQDAGRLSPPRLAARLALAAQLGLAGETWEDSEGYDLAADDAHVFSRELLLLVNLQLAPDALVADLTRLLQVLAKRGVVKVPTTQLDDVTCELVATNISQPVDVLWQLLANAAVAGGYADGPDDGEHADEAAEDEDEGEEDDEEEDVAFLLRAPGVHAVLARAIQLRHGEYPTPSYEADLALLEQARPAEAATTALPLPPATHALQLRVSERSVLVAAQAVLDAHSPAVVPQPGAKRPAECAAPGGDGAAKRPATGGAAWSLFD